MGVMRESSAPDQPQTEQGPASSVVAVQPGSLPVRALGKTGLDLPVLSFGGWAIGGNDQGNSYGPTDDDESRRALQRAWAMGCRLVETADVYGHGHSESLIGEMLGDKSEVRFCSKVGADFYGQLDTVRLNFYPSYIRFALEKSLKRLRRDVLDLYMLHNPPPQVVGDERLYETLEMLRQEGLIRHYGVSIHQMQEGLDAIRTGAPAFLLVPYNLMHRAADETLLEEARQAGVGIIVREALANGFLAGRTEGHHRWAHGDIRHTWPAQYVADRARAAAGWRRLERPGRTLAQAALQFPLMHPGVTTVSVGCKTVAQVEENFRALDLPLSPEDVRPDPNA